MGVWLNRILLRALKDTVKSVTAGLSNMDLGLELERTYASLEKYGEEIRTLCVDGSSHDAH